MSKKGRSFGGSSDNRTAGTQTTPQTAPKRSAFLLTAIAAAVAALIAVAWIQLSHGASTNNLGRPSSQPGSADRATDSARVADSTMDGEAKKLLADCSDAAVVECMGAGLEKTLRARGQVPAFDLLLRVRNSPRLAGKDHALAHRLGRLAYQVTRNPGQAQADCPGEMGSGCLHGVIEEYFLVNGAAASVANLCGGPGRTPQAMHQCWHGVGHGLYMSHGYDWVRAVKQCASIAEPMDRVNCSSGVFMQHGMDDGHPDASMAGMPGMPGMPAQSHNAAGDSRAHAGDLLYPCNIITQREVAIGCWQMQPFAVLKLTNNSFERVFWACSQAGPYEVLCEEGIGQAAGSVARINSKRALSFCDAAPYNGQPWRNCMIGAIKDNVVQAHSLVPALAVCRTANADYARDCYGAIGVVHRSMEPRPSMRVSACASVPAPYVNDCAGLFASSSASPAPPNPTERSPSPPHPDVL